MKRKSYIVSACCALAFTTAVSAQIINTGFTAADGYANGDLAAHAGWGDVDIGIPNMLKVEDAAGAGVITTANAAHSNATDSVFLSSATVANALKDEITIVKDFSISRTTNDWDNGAVFLFGLSSVTTNLLGKGDYKDLTFSLDTDFSTDGEIELVVGGETEAANIRLAALGAAASGWDAESGEGNPAADLLTQNLRVTAKIRKTEVNGYYALSGTLENLDNPTNVSFGTVYQFRTNAYDAASLNYMLAYPGGAAELDIPGEYMNPSIDSLSITVANNVAPAALNPAVVAVDAGNGYVNLSWANVIEADQYVVRRTAADAGIGGPYNDLVTTVSSNGYSDTAIVNGSTYHYIITATNLTYGLSSDSSPAVATPDQAVTGTIIDTTFAAVGDPSGVVYVNGDLADQSNWKANANSVPGAFSVDASGSGFAQGFASAAKTNDSSVYWSKISSNGVGAVWSGTISFKVNATNAQTTTRAGDGATIAVFDSGGPYPIFGWGISSDVVGSDFLELHSSGSSWGFSDDAVIRAWVGSDGSIKFGLNNRYHGSADILTLQEEQLGWQPTSTDTNIAPDFETDMISVDWQLRKTSSTNNYSATVTATIGSNVYAGVWNFNNVAPNALWAAPTAQFAMQHIVDPQDLLDVYVDSVKVSHTNNSDIPITVPTGLNGTLDPAVLGVNLVWSSLGEETGGFNIYRSSTGTAPGDFSLLTNVTTTAFQDTDVVNKTVYIYKVTGVFPTGESAPTDSFAIRVLTTAQVPGLYYSAAGGNGTVTSTFTPAYNAAAPTNGIVLKTGNGAGGTSKIPVGAAYDSTKSPWIYGWFQDDAANPVNTHTFWAKNGEDRLRYRNSDGGNNASLDYVQVDAPVDASSGKFIMYAGNWGGNTRAAIRNGGIWYASETTADNSEQTLDLATERWAVFSTPAVGDPLVDVSGASFATVNMSQVDAVGILRGNNNATVNAHIKYFSLVTQDKATAFEDWMFGYGIYNADATFTNDYDGDGVSNGEEWGLAGHPANPGNDGVQQKYIGMDASGTNFVYIHPARSDWPVTGKPVYTLLATDNLVFTPFAPAAPNTVIPGDAWVSGGGATNNSLIAVTNMVPAADAVKFLKLEITE